MIAKHFRVQGTSCTLGIASKMYLKKIVKQKKYRENLEILLALPTF